MFIVEGLFENLSESSDKTRKELSSQHPGMKQDAEPIDPSGYEGDPAPELERQL